LACVPLASAFRFSGPLRRFLNDPSNFTGYRQVIREAHKDGTGNLVKVVMLGTRRAAMLGATARIMPLADQLQ